MFCRCKIIIPVVMLAFYINACTSTKKVVPLPETVTPPPVALIPLSPLDNAKTDAFLSNLLTADPQLNELLSHSKEWNTQIIYTQIDRGGNGVPVLNNYYFNVDPTKYFYPASTVKFPISLLALQRLNELKAKGIDKNTTMITEAGNDSQTAVYNDPSSIDGRPTIGQYIKKILMVSDNDAYNRLYEFLGQDYINDQLHKKGYDDVQILHRLEVFLSEAENRQTNPVKFIDADGRVLYEQPLQSNTNKYLQRNDSLGKGYYKGGNLMNGAMNFSGKNRIALQDLHNILISLVFPDNVPAKMRFNLTEDDRNFVLKYMSQLPTESTYPPYSADTAAYWPSYCKFLLFGADKGVLPKNIRSFNKPGDAYGQILDVAYIVDYEKGVEFFLSAVTYCNSDGILNDDKYDYKTVGLPFMKNLGKVIYDYETKRVKKHQPNLSDLKFIYDK